MVGKVVSGLRRPLAVLPVTGDRAVDQSWIEVGYRLVANAEVVQDAGAKALDEDVGLAGQVEDAAQAGGCLEICQFRQLPGIDLGVERVEGAGRVTTGWLDPVDLCAQVGQQPGGVGTGKLEAEVE